MLAQTPTLDGLAAGGIRFDDAITSVPITLPSHATILTGLYPPSHGVRDNGKYALADEHVTLAETLQAHGYETAAFVGCFVVDARFGLAQGFDVYDFQVTPDGHRPRMLDFNERPADAVTDAAIRWLSQRRQANATGPFFAWVHYFDPHLPYRSPLQKLARFAARPYDAEIAFVDAQLKRLLDELKRHDLRERTLIAVVADHGEALGEHGEPTHGMLLYAPTMRVPFILHCPALFDGPYRVGDRVVGLADLRPTLEDLLGITPTTPADGVSLLRSNGDPNRAIYIETQAPLNLAGWSPLYGLRTHTHKYILAPEPEYFDLQSDPGESRNLHASQSPGLEALKHALAQRMETWPAADAAARRLSDEEIERLSALGYVRAGVQPGDGPLPDPKKMMPIYNQALEAERLYGQRRYEEAAGLARRVLEQCPASMQATRVLAFSYLKLGRADEAVELLRSSVERNPDVFLIRSLAQLLIIQRECDDAEAVLKVYESVDPSDGRVPLLRGDCFARQGLHARAIEQYQQAIVLDENRVGLVARERIERTLEEAQGD
jgi:arylsulfatase A-like enzyme